AVSAESLNAQSFKRMAGLGNGARRRGGRGWSQDCPCGREHRRRRRRSAGLSEPGPPAKSLIPPFFQHVHRSASFKAKCTKTPLPQDRNGNPAKNYIFVHKLNFPMRFIANSSALYKKLSLISGL